MSRSKPRSSNSNNDGDFKAYRDAAPEQCDDKTLRALIKEHATKEKIQAAIQNLWESDTPVPVEEEWNTTTKPKKNMSQGEGVGASERNSGGGRGRTRVAAGGRGAGARQSDFLRERPSAARVNAEVATGSIATPVPSVEADESVPATGAVKGNVWGKKSAPSQIPEVAASVTKTSVSGSKGVLQEPVQKNTAWGKGGETMAEKLKRIEREKQMAEEEKNNPPAPPAAVEETPASTTATEKAPKKKKPYKKERGEKIEKSPAAVPTGEAADVVEPVSEPEIVPFQNLTISSSTMPEVEAPASPPKVKSNTSEDVQDSPKIGLTMGKYNNNDNKGLSAMEFGSFGNATTSLVAEEPSSASTAWGATTGDSSSSEVPLSGAAVWSNGQQSDSSNNANGTNQNGPPGLGGNAKPQRSAPGQSRNKGESQQSGQHTQSSYQQPQPPGFGAPGSRGGPMSNMAYGQPEFDQQHFLHQQFQQAAVTPAAAAPTASTTSTAATLSPSTGSMPQQSQPTYPQSAPGMTPQFYGQNPYYYAPPQGFYYPQHNYGNYNQHQQRGYQNGGRGGPNHYDHYAAASAYGGGGDSFGQFGAAGQAGTSHGSKPTKDNAAQDQSSASPAHQQQQMQQQAPSYQQYMNYGTPNSFLPSYSQGGYGMYPGSNPTGAPQGGGGGGRDNQRGGYGNNNYRSTGQDANTQQQQQQSGYNNNSSNSRW